MFHRLLYAYLEVVNLIHGPGVAARRSASSDRAGGALDESGQTTAEYALVIIAAAAIAGLLLAWATKTNAISKLLDRVVDLILPG